MTVCADDTFTADLFWQSLCEEAASSGMSGSCLFMRREQVTVCDCIDSTNSELMRRIDQAGNLRDEGGALTAAGRDMHLSLVAASLQTAGRGRVGRKFYSPSGTGIYFSFAYVPEGGVSDPTVYTVTAAVGVCRAVERLYGVPVQIKWVNDIYARGKKICGILTEGSVNAGKGCVEAAVVGIGVNIQLDEAVPADVRARAGGILAEGEQTSVTRARLLAACILEIYRSLGTAEDVIPEYKARSMLTGTMLCVTPLAGDTSVQYSARALGITDDAGLLVELADGSRKVLHSGEVSLHVE